jgi:hypothetical protein
MNDQTPVTKHVIDEDALAAAVGALNADLRDAASGGKTVRRLRTVIGIGGALSLFASLGTQTRLPLGFWAFMLTLGGTGALVVEILKRRTQRGGSLPTLAVSIGALAVSSIALRYAPLIVPWAVGGVVIGALGGWWINRLKTHPEVLVWTPGGDDLRFQDAGGSSDVPEFLAVIIAPYAGRREAIDAAANVFRGLGNLAAVLAWLPTSRETPGRAVLEQLSDDERRLLAIAIRMHAAGRELTPPAPHAPLPPAPPA